MPRKPRPLDRDQGTLRDASLLFIASEDKYATDQYFSRFKAKRVQVKVSPTNDGRSAPQHVMERIEEFRKEYLTEDGDTFWLCIDRDRWDRSVLSEVLSQCTQKAYGFAISNPCFELWVVLHLENVAATPRQTPVEIKKRLADLLGGGYSKDCCRQIPLTPAMVTTAIQRAKSQNITDVLVDANHSQVYLILEAIMARGGFELPSSSANPSSGF